MINFREQSIEQLISGMTPADKIGQMTQVEKGSIAPSEVADFGIGSVLSGGGGNPTSNNPAAWAEMVDSFLEASGDSRLGIPLLYGLAEESVAVLIVASLPRAVRFAQEHRSPYRAHEHTSRRTHQSGACVRVLIVSRPPIVAGAGANASRPCPNPW